MPRTKWRALLVYSTMSHQSCSTEGLSSLRAEWAASLHEFELGSVETVVADEPAREGTDSRPDSDEHGLAGRRGVAEWATGAPGRGWAGGGEDERGVSHWPEVAAAVIDEGAMLVVVIFSRRCGGDGGAGSAGHLEGRY